MEPEEHLIDSLLHEHHRVSGDVDTDFLNSLEQKLDVQEKEQSNQPPAKKSFPYWIPAAVAAGIVALISISLINNTRTKNSHLAIGLENASPPSSPSIKTNPQPFAKLDDEAEASEMVQDEMSERLNVEDSAEKASGRVASAKLSESVQRTPMLQNYKTSDRLADLQPANIYTHELAQAQTLLLEVSQQPLPDMAFSLSQAEKESLQLAFTILKSRTRSRKQRENASLADEPDEPSFSPAETPSLVSPTLDSTRKRQAKREAQVSSKIKALHLFRKVYAVKPEPRSSKSHGGDVLPSPTKTVIQALESWEKSLK